MKKIYKQYNSIDLFKFLFAIVVVMIHTTPFMDVSESFSWYFNNTFCNLAVPFFFVASGFIFFDKLDGVKQNEKQRLKKYILHILKMYIVWCIVWIPWKALYLHSTGWDGVAILDYIRDLILVSGGDALWYLPALILSIAVVYGLYTRIQSPKVIVAVATIPYVIGVVISSYYGLFGGAPVIDWYYAIFKTVDNGIMHGVMFVSIGMYIAKAKPNIVRFRDITFFIIAFVTIIGEAILINKLAYNRAGECNLIALPIAAYYLIKVILSIDLRDNKIYAYLRDYSTLIYLSHCFIIRTLKLSFEVININVGNIGLFIITVVLSLIFASSIRYFAKEKNWKFFRLLY